MIFRALVLSSCLVCGLSTGSAQEARDSTLAGTIGVFVFPAEGQEETEQSRDEAECYGWAVDRTGSDPFELARRSEQETASAERAAEGAERAGQGAAAGGAVTGAAAGALVGRVFGSSKTARRTAKAGAAVGAIAGAEQRQQARARADRSADEAARRAQSTEARMEDFRKAFSACLEANDYVARY